MGYHEGAFEICFLKIALKESLSLIQSVIITCQELKIMNWIVYGFNKTVSHNPLND